MNAVIFHSFWTVALLILFIGIVLWAFSSRRKRGFDEAARLPLEDEDSHMFPLSPTPLPQAGEGSSVRSEPSALRATSFTRGEKQHG
jgi:cytochrome c oxidase cbb3-type subunit 4